MIKTLKVPLRRREQLLRLHVDTPGVFIVCKRFDVVKRLANKNNRIY